MREVTHKNIFRFQHLHLYKHRILQYQPLLIEVRVGIEHADGGL